MMPINLKKILLLDDKPHHVKGCGVNFIEKLVPQLSEYIHFVSNLKDIANFQNEKCILKIDISEYIFFLFHVNYTDSLFTGTEQALLREEFGNTMIGFSGDGQIEEGYNLTSRELIFSRLDDILACYHITGQIDFKAFFNPNAKLHNRLLDDMVEVLVVQEKSGFLESKELKIWSHMKGSNLEKLKTNLSALTDEEIVNRIENNWRPQEILWNI
jgi:hypothetical protein